MAYDKKPIRVLAGGLVTVAPGDVINDDDSQELVNFTTDSQGALKSRRGHTVVCSVSGVENQIKGTGGRYQNDGSSVYKTCAAVMSGVDGPTLVAWKDFVWSPPRKTNGSADWRWIPEAPAGTPTAKPAGEVVTPVDDFTSGWTVDPSGSDTYDPTLRIQPGGEGVFSAEKAFAEDLYTGFDKDDMFRIRLKAKHWDVVTGVTFEVDVNTGDFKKDYYSAVMSFKNLNAAKKEEITFYIRKRPLPVDDATKDKNRYGSFQRIGTTPEKDWRSVVKLRVKVAFSDGTKFWFENWEMVGNAENTLEGDDFRVAVTYVTDAGHESNPSEFSDPIEVKKTGIDVTSIPPSGDAQVTKMRVYLTGGTLQGVYSVTGPAIPFATSYNIRAREDEITGFNIQLEDDHQDPPSGVVWGVGPYFDRIILFKGNRYYWSHQNKPYAFAHPDDETGGDWGAIEESLGDIKHVTMRPGQLWIHCQNGVAIMEGDPGGPASSVHRASSQMGVSSQQGVVQAPEGDYCNFAEGIYLFNGGSAQEISRKIQNIFKGSWTPSSAAMGFRNSVVWASDGSRTFKWDAGTDRWFEDSRVFTSFYWDGGALLGATVGGQIVQLESGFSDGGSAIPVAWTSKYYDCGALDNEKVFEDLTLWIDTGGATLTVTALLDNGATSIALGTVNTSGEERVVFQFDPEGEGVVARNIAIRVTGNVSAECSIKKVVINQYLKAREGKSFDTGEIGLGTHKVKLLKEVVWDIDNPGSVSVLTKSDRPIPMANRSTDILVSSSDRRMLSVVYDSEIIGRLFRLVGSGTDYRVYGGKALFQVLGTYLEDDEYYNSDPIDFGTERIKLLREIQMIYAGDLGTFTLETDLPGNALAARHNAGFPTISDEQSITLRTGGIIKGRLYRVEVRPQTGGTLRIEAIRLRLKTIGSPNASSWEWYPLPLESTQDAIWTDVGFPADLPG